MIIYLYESRVAAILLLYTGNSMDSIFADDVLNQSQRLCAGEDFVRVNILVPPALRKEWKAIALASDKTLTSYIIEAMQHQIKQTKKTETPTI
jgi:hypothetical protein